MSTTQLMEHCRYCGKPTLHLEEKPNHILHLLLTIVTMGVWLIVWVLLGMSSRLSSSTCTVCGSVPPAEAVSAPRPPKAGAVSLGRALGRAFGRIGRR